MAYRKRIIGEKREKYQKQKAYYERQKLEAYERAGIGKPVIRRPGESESQAVERSASETAQLAVSSGRAPPGSGVQVSVRSPSQMEAERRLAVQSQAQARVEQARQARQAERIRQFREVSRETEGRRIRDVDPKIIKKNGKVQGFQYKSNAQITAEQQAGQDRQKRFDDFTEATKFRRAGQVQAQIVVDKEGKVIKQSFTAEKPESTGTEGTVAATIRKDGLIFGEGLTATEKYLSKSDREITKPLDTIAQTFSRDLPIPDLGIKKTVQGAVSGYPGIARLTTGATAVPILSGAALVGTAINPQGREKLSRIPATELVPQTAEVLIDVGFLASGVQAAKKAAKLNAAESFVEATQRQKGKLVSQVKVPPSTENLLEIKGRPVENILLAERTTPKARARIITAQLGAEETIPVAELNRAKTILVQGNFEKKVKVPFPQGKAVARTDEVATLVSKERPFAADDIVTLKGQKSFYSTSEDVNTFIQRDVGKPKFELGDFDVESSGVARLRFLDASSETGLVRTTAKTGAKRMRRLERSKPVMPSKGVEQEILGVIRQPGGRVEYVFEGMGIPESRVQKLRSADVILVAPKRKTGVFQITSTKVKPSKVTQASDIIGDVATKGTATTSGSSALVQETVQETQSVTTQTSKQQSTQALQQQTAKSQSFEQASQKLSKFYKTKQPFVRSTKFAPQTKTTFAPGTILGNRQAVTQRQATQTRQQLKQQQLSQLRETSRTGQNLGVKNLQGSILGQQFSPASSLSSRQDFQSFFRGKSSRIRTDTPRQPRQPGRPRPPKLPSLESDSTVLDVFTYQRGRRVPIARGINLRAAANIGKNLVSGTAAASIDIRIAGTTRKPSAQTQSRLGNLLGKAFRPGKTRPGTFVEQTKFRINTPGELRQITFKGISAQRTRKNRRSIL